MDLLKIFNLLNNKIDFFCGVPDSTLKQITQKIKNNHITPNEGSAVALAAGYNLATNKIPLVYMQNSGLSNAINPISSITHNKVYSIPIIYLIGWRGSPNSNDEPQHKIKGKITKDILKLLNIKFTILDRKISFLKFKKKLNIILKQKQQHAFLVPFELTKENKQKKKLRKKNHTLFTRSVFIIEFLKKLNLHDKIISTTGYTSRELNQIRSTFKLKKGNDFYMIGGMGHTSMVSLGANLFSKNRVFCLDGDGSLLMHMGNLVNVGYYGNKNFNYILLNNGKHESVGNHDTLVKNIKFKEFSKSIGFKNYFLLSEKKKTKMQLEKLFKSKGPNFFEVRIETGTLEKLSRPKNFINIKKNFQKNFKI